MVVQHKRWKRVISPLDLLTIGGKALTNKGKRYTSLAALAGAAAITADIVGERVLGFEIPLDKTKLAMMPVITAGLTFGLGQLMCSTAKFFNYGNANAALANSGLSLNDQKLDDNGYHAKLLWDHVFKYESQLHNNAQQKEAEERKLTGIKTRLYTRFSELTDEELKFLGIERGEIDGLVKRVLTAHPTTSNMEASEEGWTLSAEHALEAPLAQILQQEKVGFDISIVESYRNLGPFESLYSQYALNALISDARNRVGRKPVEKALEFLFSSDESLLTKLTRNRLQCEGGRLLSRLGIKDVQPFFWPDQEVDEAFRRRYGKQTLKRLKRGRKEATRKIFSRSYTEAKRHVYAMFETEIVKSLGLRFAYDVEFMAGVLDQTPQSELEEIEELAEQKIYSRREIRKKTERAKSSYEASEDFSERLRISNPFHKRAIALAHYMGHHNLSDGLNDFAKVTSETDQYTNELTQVRLLSTLSPEQLRFHTTLVKDMGEYN